MLAVGQDQTPASLMLKTGNNSTEPPRPRSLPPPAPPPPLHLPPVKAMPVRTAQIPRKSRKVIQAAAQEVLALHQGHLLITVTPKVAMLGSHQQQQTVPLKYHQTPAAVMEHPALLLRHQAHQGQQVPLLVIRQAAPVLEVHQDSLLATQTQEIILE